MISSKNCNNTPDIPKGLKKIFVFSEHEYMLIKFKSFLSKSFPITEYDEYLLIEADFEKLLQNLLEANHLFTELELDNIYIIPLELDSHLNIDIKLIKNLKTLSYFIHLFKAQDFKWILDNANIIIESQPIINISTMEIFGYELLSRGINQQGLKIYPDILFDKARKTNMLFYLDKICRLKAIEYAKQKNIHKNVFINFNPASIYNPEFSLLDTINKAKELNFDFSNIVFEIVESEKQIDFKHLRNIINYYKDRGFKIALDDVGSGYSSLSVLAELKPEFIKIDKNIVKNIYKDNTKKAIVQSLVNLGEKIQVVILAEGVETEEEFATIKELGVHLAQGYLFGKPSSEPLYY